MQDDDMTLKQKIIFWTFMTLISLSQLAGVIFISYINHRVYECIGIYVSMAIGKFCFRKTWHSDSLLICTVTTLTVYYFLTCGVLPVSVSIFCSVLFGYVLAYFLYRFELLKEKVNSVVKIHSEFGYTELDVKKMSSKELFELCKEKSFSEWDTNFLIDFFLNPDGLRKYEIADKYKMSDKHIYKVARRLMNKLNS